MIVDAAVERFLHGLQPSPDPVLQEMEAVAEERGFPIVGPLVGRLLEQLARLAGARRVFEMGSGYGYSTLWFARAVGEGGEVVHTDGDPRLTAEARTWLARAGLEARVRFETGDALEILAGEGGPFDVVFCDVDKEAYPAAWRLARERVAPGGLVVFDNALWQGRVVDPQKRDPATQGVRGLVEAAFGDPSFLTTLLPLRDGVLVARRVT